MPARLTRLRRRDALRRVELQHRRQQRPKAPVGHELVERGDQRAGGGRSGRVDDRWAAGAVQGEEGGVVLVAVGPAAADQGCRKRLAGATLH